MGSGGVLPGRDPPVRAETAHQSERTRVTVELLNVLRRDGVLTSGSCR